MNFDATQIASSATAGVIAAAAAFCLGMALTPVYTHLAFKYKAWKKIRSQTTTGEKAAVFFKLHEEKHKRNIPTMAGVVMIVTILVVTALLNFSFDQTLLPLVATVAAGLVGLVDDLINIRGPSLGTAGLTTRMKFMLIFLIGLIGALYVFFKLGYTSIHVPFYDAQLQLGLLLIPFFVLVVVATANAVNITDGLDGLSGGLLAIAFTAYGIVATLQGNYGIGIFCMTVVGAVLAYTWFNIHPARFFMGDTGSFALGTALGIIALLTDTILILPIIGGIFVLEASSSTLQILSKKFLKRKIFLSAPIHHHFEALGWPETKVTMRFWVLGAILAAMGVMVAILGGAVQ